MPDTTTTYTLTRYSGLEAIARRLYETQQINEHEHDLLVAGFVPASQDNVIHAEVNA